MIFDRTAIQSLTPANIIGVGCADDSGVLATSPGTLRTKLRGQSGYTIHVYTREQWIQYMARFAQREMLPFSARDMTPEMHQRMLHVVAMPRTPDYVNGSRFAGSSSVHRIVLTDMRRQVIIQPVALSNAAVTESSAFRSTEFTTARAAFMSDVDKLRASDSKGEFFIRVTGDRQNRSFE